jgi:chromosomal replication initiator protein
MPVSSTLHQFLLLPENRSAYRALQSAEKNLRQQKSKLIFIYGLTGSGKSHLICQALREYRRSNPKLKFEHVTAAEFAAQLADASTEERLPEFQQHYRNLDLFVCEDLQSLQKRKESQRQLVVCLDALEEKGSLIILSSTTLPGSWQRADRRLVDRCRGGLSVEIELPSTNSRQKLIAHFAQTIHEPLPKSISSMIAETVDGAPRDLKSVMDRLLDSAHRLQQPLTPEFVERFLNQEIAQPEPALKEIIRITARHFDLKVRDLKSASRRADVVYARQCAMYLARELTTLTQTQIAQAMGKADHTAVIRACQKIQKLLAEEASTRHELAELKDALRP